MKAANPYLNFPGNTEEAFEFYRSVFGGEFASVMRFGEMPEGDPVPEPARDKIMHIALPIGNGNMLMATDAVESMGQSLEMGNNVHIALEAESRDEADRLFRGLSEGGRVTMAMQDQFWGAYFGMLTDRFGVQWMVSHSAEGKAG